MYRLFTLQEATEMLPTVDELLAQMQATSQELLAVRQRLAAARPLSIEARNATQEADFLLSELHTNKAELDRLGVFVTDFETGAVDFPSQLGAEVVCLSWARGQDGITHYHRLGEDAVKPLPPALAERDGIGA